VNSTGRDIAGSILMILGLLIALLTGSCTLLFGGYAFEEAFRRDNVSDTIQALALPLMFGVLPFVLRVTCAVIGWRLVARPRTPD
jgi:hypothetical protein